jgi:hypothetical protein
MEARSGIEPLYTALQAAASPLCHLAEASQFSTPTGLALTQNAASPVNSRPTMS